MSRKAAWILAICAVLTNLVNFLDRQTLTVLAPTVRKALDITQSQYGWLASAFGMAYFVSSPIAGKLLDRFGARRGLVVSVTLWSIVSGLHALVPSFAILIVLRIGLGISESAALPGGSQIIVRSLPPLDRPRGLGLLFVGSSLGSAIAAPFASAMSDSWSWRWAFVGTAAAGLLWVPLWIAVSSRAPAKAVLDRAPVPKSTAKLPGVLETLRRPAIFRGVLAVFLVSPAVAISSFWSSQKLATDHHIVQKAVGHYLWLPPLGIDVGALLFGELFARRAKRRDGSPDRLLFVIAVLLVAAGAFVASSATGPWSAVAGFAVMMCGASALYTVMMAELTARAGDAAAKVGGLVIGAQSLAFVIANPIIGSIVDHTQTFSQVLVGIGGLALLAIASWGAVRHRAVTDTDRSPPA